MVFTIYISNGQGGWPLNINHHNVTATLVLGLKLDSLKRLAWPVSTFNAYQAYGHQLINQSKPSQLCSPLRGYTVTPMTHIMYLHCTMIYGQLGLTIGHSLWASWGQAGLQGVAMIYGPAQVC